MAFTLSGSTITQIGTDTDLFGLSSITGVTTLNTGTKIIINIGTLELNINGNLSFNAIQEQIITTGNNPTNQFDISGTLTINGKKTINGTTIDTYEYGIVSTATNLVNCCSNGVLTVRSGGELYLNGSSIEVGSVIDFETGSTLRTDNGKIVTRRDIGNNSVRIRIATGMTVDVNGLITEGISLDLSSVPTRLDNYAPKIVNGLHGAQTFNVVASLRDFNPEGSLVDFDNWNNENAFLINPVRGTDMIMTGSNNNAKITLTKEVQFNLTTLGSENIAGAKVYSVDTNNGNRAVVAGLPPEINALQNIVYNLETNADGETPLTEFYLGFARGGHVINNPTGGVIDLRGNADVKGADTFTFRFASYNHSLSQGDYVLNGAGVLNQTRVLFDDLSITEQNKETVDSYTELETAQKFYDRAKAYFVNNYAGERETIVTRSGNEINARSYNVVINNTGSAFAFDGTTITINASSFVNGGITTTGTITIADGVDINGMYIDGDVLVEGEMQNIENVEVTGTFSFNSDVDKEIIVSNSTIGKLENNGTGQLSFENRNSTVTDITDIEVTQLQDAFTINLTGILAGSSVWIGDLNKTRLTYATGQDGTYSFTTDRGYGGNLNYVVKKAGFTVFKGVVAVDGSTTSANIGVTQNILKDTDGTNMYNGGLTSSNLTYSKSRTKITGSVTADITAKVFFDEFQLFGETEDGCAWLSDNDDMQRITAGAGKQQIIFTKNINVTNGSLAGTYKIQAEIISQESPFDVSVAGSVSDSSSVGITAQDVWEHDISNINTAGQAGKELVTARKKANLSASLSA